MRYVIRVAIGTHWPPTFGYRLKDKKRAGIFMVPPGMAGDSEPQANLRPALKPNRA